MMEEEPAVVVVANPKPIIKTFSEDEKLARELEKQVSNHFVFLFVFSWSGVVVWGVSFFYFYFFYVFIHSFFEIYKS